MKRFNFYSIHMLAVVMSKVFFKFNLAHVPIFFVCIVKSREGQEYAIIYAKKCHPTGPSRSGDAASWERTTTPIRDENEAQAEKTDFPHSLFYYIFLARGRRLFTTV